MTPVVEFKGHGTLYKVTCDDCDFTVNDKLFSQTDAGHTLDLVKAHLTGTRSVGSEHHIRVKRSAVSEDTLLNKRLKELLNGQSDR